MKTAILILAPALAAAQTSATSSGGDSLFDFDYSESHDGSCTAIKVLSQAPGTEGGIAVTYTQDCVSNLENGVVSYDSRKMKAMADFFQVTEDTLELYGQIEGSEYSMHDLTSSAASEVDMRPKDMTKSDSNVQQIGGMQNVDGFGTIVVVNSDKARFKVTCVVQYNGDGQAVSSTVQELDTITTALTGDALEGGDIGTATHNTNNNICGWNVTVSYDHTAKGEFWYGGWGASTGNDYETPSNLAIPNSLYTYAHGNRDVTFSYEGFDFGVTINELVGEAESKSVDVTEQLEVVYANGDHSVIKGADTLTYEIDCHADLRINPHQLIDDVEIFSDDPFLLQTVVFCYEARIQDTVGSDTQEVDIEVIKELHLQSGNNKIAQGCAEPNIDTHGTPKEWRPTSVVAASLARKTTCDDQLNTLYKAGFYKGDTQVTPMSPGTSRDVNRVWSSSDSSANGAAFELVNIDVKDGRAAAAQFMSASDVTGDVLGLAARLTRNLVKKESDENAALTISEGMPYVHMRSWARLVVDNVANPRPDISELEITFEGAVKATLRNGTREAV